MMKGINMGRRKGEEGLTGDRLSWAGSRVTLGLLLLPPSLQARERFHFTGCSQGRDWRGIKDFKVSPHQTAPRRLLSQTLGLFTPLTPHSQHSYAFLLIFLKFLKSFLI